MQFRALAITRKLCYKDNESHSCYASTHCSAACGKAVDDVTHPDLGWRATRHSFLVIAKLLRTTFLECLGPRRAWLA